jgi:CubicO group peptidase (beta-lactamase class C family)
MAVAILEEQGRVDREDLIVQYLEKVPDYMSTIRIRHLVHHLSGLPDYADAL